ncbi:16665_t:CDS:1, partial [Acaulospora colombiana]
MNLENDTSNSTCSTQILNKNLKGDKFVRPHIPIKTHLLNLYNEAKVHAVSLDYEYNSTSKKLVLERMQCNNGLVAAILQAYNGHQHLRLIPDDIWFTIAQGVSHHINLNADTYKDRFVKRKSIVIYNECILSIDPKTKCLVGDWPECIRQLLEAADKQIKKVELQSSLECDFSTSSQNTIIPSRVVLLDTFKRCSSFQFNVFCGIPKVTLEGTLNDWISIKEKLVQLRQFFPDLEFWLDPLEH